jgi:PAS domain S-box-containing protein
MSFDRAALPEFNAPSFGWQLFDSSPDCIKLLDREGRVLAMNRNGRCAMEIDATLKVEGLPWTALWPAALHAEVEGAVATALQGGTGTFVACYPNAEQILKWWDVVVTPIRGADGQVAQLLAISRDVSAAHQAERALQAANERINAIFQQAPAFMCVLRGPDHVFEMINERYLQLVGNRDLIGQSVRAALPEVVDQGFLDLLDRVYTTGEPFSGVDMPVMLQRQPGMLPEQRFIDLAYIALRDADGKITGLLAHGVDQTHRKLTEMELYESRERFQKIVSQAATGVVEMDTGGRITFVNRKYADMLGYQPDELLGLDVLDVTAPDSVQNTRDTVGKVLAGGEQAVIDKHYLRRDGSLLPATSSVNPLRGPDGESQGLVAIVLDTTDSVRAAEELRASEERYRTLFESVDQGFCIIDMILDEQGEPVDYRFIEMNATFERHTGLAGATGRTALELVPGLDRFWVDTYGRVARTGEAARFENGSEAMGRWFDVYATRIGGNASRRVALLFSDISARKHADATLQKLAADLAEPTAARPSSWPRWRTSCAIRWRRSAAA